MINWLCIQTAPLDRRVMLYYDKPILGNHVLFGKYSNDQFANKPNPYWTNALERLYGVKETRKMQPQFWAEVPNGPLTTYFR